MSMKIPRNMLMRFIMKMHMRSFRTRTYIELNVQGFLLFLFHFIVESFYRTSLFQHSDIPIWLTQGLEQTVIKMNFIWTPHSNQYMKAALDMLAFYVKCIFPSRISLHYLQIVRVYNYRAGKLNTELFSYLQQLLGLPRLSIQLMDDVKENSELVAMAIDPSSCRLSSQ